MVVIVVALASSIAWGAADFLGGLTARRVRVIAVVLVAQAIALACVAAVVAARGRGAPPLDEIGFALLAGVAGTLGVVAFYYALSIGVMSIVAPIAAIGIAIPVFAGMASGERPSWVQLAGMAAAVAGVAFAGREPPPDPQRAAELHSDRRLRRRAIGAAALAAIGFGGFMVAIDRAAETDVFWAILFPRVTTVAVLGVAVVFFARDAIRGVSAHLPALAALGVFDATANLAFVYASTRGDLSVAAVLSSLYPIVTVALAHRVLHERIARVQWVGVVTALAGVVLIAGG